MTLSKVSRYCGDGADVERGREGDRTQVTKIDPGDTRVSTKGVARNALFGHNFSI